MGIKSIVFFIDLNTLDKKSDEKLKKFAIDEDLEEKDIISIIYNEANKMGIKDNAKVTFKMLDDDEDSFRVIVEPYSVMYKGTVIYPFYKIKSQDFELKLDSVLGKVTLYNKKKDCKAITVSIDGIGLDIFSMSYQKAKELLKDLSDRKEEGGYLEFPDSICFKHFGIKLNVNKSDNGDLKVDDIIASIDVFNKESFFKEYYFEEVKKEEEKYDVNIPLPDEYNYEKKNENINNTPKEEKEQTQDLNNFDSMDIEIDIPKQDTKDEVQVKEQTVSSEVDTKEDELEQILKKQDEELKRVKEKLKKELEEELNSKKYDEEIEEDNQEEKIEIEIEEPEKAKVENIIDEEKVKQELLESRIKKKLQELKENNNE